MSVTSYGWRKATPLMEIPTITFTATDFREDLLYPQGNPLIVALRVGVANVKRVLIDTGSPVERPGELSVKLFIWKLHTQKLPTQVFISRFGLSSGQCPFCFHLEDMEHLFFECWKPLEIWSCISYKWAGVSWPTNFQECWLSLSQTGHSQKTFSPFYNSLGTLEVQESQGV